MKAGEKIPDTGTYRCEWCGRGGRCEALTLSALKLMGTATSGLRPPMIEGKREIHAFEKDSTFLACPKCDTCADWEPYTKKWWQFWK